MHLSPDPVASADISKMVVITLFGLLKLFIMPFGLKNEAQAFQRLMDVILHDCNFVFVYLDEILIDSCTNHEHEAHLLDVFHLLSDSDMGINLKKSVFGVSKLIYLGHCITTSGIIPLESIVTAVSNFPAPTHNSVSSISQILPQAPYPPCCHQGQRIGN